MVSVEELKPLVQTCYSHAGKWLRHFLSTPFIYMVLFPLLLLDVVLELYHRICFPVYGMPLVRRADYFAVDRELLPYLTWFQKLNCLYCTYANGLLLYASAIAAETERYWCPIKHAKHGFKAPAHHVDFADFGDEKCYRERVK